MCWNKLSSGLLMLGLILFQGATTLLAQDETREFKVFQFPADKIPVIDGKSGDWDLVPHSYTVGMDQLWDDSKKHNNADQRNLDVKVKVAWVNGLNRLYFLYEAYDDYWDFSHPGLHNDTFELIVDADQSGGPFIDRFHPNKSLDSLDAYFSFHGVHAQNYHIFTPAVGKDWTLVWGSQPWIKELPYANAAYDFNFKPGQKGKLTMEFWITPFDYAGAEGPSRAVESVLTENKNIGLCWAVIDYDDVDAKSHNGFWNLSKEHTMYGNASYSLPFKLMPLESRFRRPLEANWSFKILNSEERSVAFKDESYGEIQSWRWDFGDQTSSTEQNPVHRYKNRGKYVVTLYIKGPRGEDRRAKVWDVVVR
ncbi:PKD domain-containing protein [Arcticibacter pallidicorallinus]|uniref:PKD domain-containing protein n=1 Tax=Arcticibacter pallidicorallinus TaxID=1259464 RepID=A0A2T0U5R3_9SPHI|nr:PKD domain-containing protein [Arcticibacter pallidicorallinus]PRY53266.1 PKD domain-containing protein [Arcticibacter pallidicorallinus]